MADHASVVRPARLSGILLSLIPLGVAVCLPWLAGLSFYLGSAEVTEANEGEAIETWFGGVRLEDGAPVASPRTLTLVRGGEAACAFTTSRTFRVEVWSEDHPERARAGYFAEGSITEGCGVDAVGDLAIVGTVADDATSSEYLQPEPLEGADRRRQLARIPQNILLHRRLPAFVSAVAIDAAMALTASSEPDEDGCVYAEQTYLLRSGGALAMPGFPERVLRLGERAYVIVVEATAAAGRPAQHLRAVSLVAGQPDLIDTDVLLPWMAGPSC